MLSWCQLRVLRSTNLAGQWRGFARKATNLDEDFPRITVPQKMVEKLEKHNLRMAREKAKMDRQKLKTLVISSKRKEYQFYKGQKFDSFDTRQLASHGWKHRNSGHDHFTLCPHAPNPSIVDERTFEELGLDRRILQYLRQEGLEAPTVIQDKMIPHMLSGRHVICAAETGSGKTYAYLLPIIHNILRQKQEGVYDTDVQNAPYCIVMVPSRELIHQVKDVCERLSGYTGINTVAYTDTRKSQSSMLKQGLNMDILILNPLSIQILLARKQLNLSRMMAVVVDEADSLLDDSFSSLTCRAMEALQIGASVPTGDVYVNEGVHVALVSATYPRGLESTVGGILPVDKMTVVRTKHLHRVMKHVPQKFIKTKAMHKLALLVEMLKERPDAVTMIFCNSTRGSYWLNQTLKESSIDNVLMNGDVDIQTRKENMRMFLEGEQNVMVCTDIVSRGVDTQKVNHVINFEFPSFMSDYIHRAGRVGRVGAKQWGQVTSFVVHSWEVDLVWKIEISVRSAEELHNVNANIKKKLVGRSHDKLTDY